MSQPSQQPNLSQDETPTQRIPRVKMPAPQATRQEKPGPGAADPPAVKAEKADTQDLGKDKPDGAQYYRERVEKAQLPDNVRKAALREVGKLERTSGKGPESGYIRSWLDTVLGLPWSTPTTDSVDIQSAHEVDPAAADTEKVAQTKVEPAAARAEKADTAPAGPKDDDTVEIPAVRARPNGGRRSQELSKQQGKLEPATTDPHKTVQTKAESATGPQKTAQTKPETAVTEHHKTAQTKVEPAAARAEKADTAPAGPKDDDTVEIPAVRARPNGGRRPQELSKQQGKLEPAATGPQKAAQKTAVPTAADPQKKPEPATARAEKADTAPAGPKDDDTVEIPAVRARPNGGRPPQELSKQQGKLQPAATGLQAVQAAPAGTRLHEIAQTKAAPAATDPHKVAINQVGPPATDARKTATAPAVLNGAGHHPSPQIPEQQVLGPVPVENPPEKKRFRWLALAAIVLAALLIGALLFGASRNGGVTAQSVPTASGTAPTVSSPTSEPSDELTDTGGGQPTIELEDFAGPARAFEPIRIQGVYQGGADTFVRVQRRVESSWVFFPLPTRTDPSGRFTAYVELGTGRYRLRVVDPRSGVRSEPFVLVVKG